MLEEGQMLHSRIQSLTSLVSQANNYDTIAITFSKGNLNGAMTLSKEEAKTVALALTKLWEKERDDCIEKFREL